MKKKILLFLFTLMYAVVLPVTVHAAEYGREYPNYVNYSGGAYIEVQCALGRGSAIFQDTYKSGYLGFYGGGCNICNLSKTTISGYFITSAGKEYDCRINSFNVIQYYYESGTTREWRSLSPTQIYNTNVEFIDETSKERNNKLDIFDGDPFKYTLVGLIFVACCVWTTTILYGGLFND